MLWLVLMGAMPKPLGALASWTVTQLGKQTAARRFVNLKLSLNPLPLDKE